MFSTTTIFPFSVPIRSFKEHRILVAPLSRLVPSYTISLLWLWHRLRVCAPQPNTTACTQNPILIKVKVLYSSLSLYI